MTKLYTIETESKYQIKLNEITNIEEAGDDFLTEDEVHEMLGHTGHISTYGPIIRRQLVVEELSTLKADLKEKNKKSMVIDNADLVAFLSESTYAVSDFVKGLRRVGNRLSLHEKAIQEKLKPTKKDLQSLIGCGCRCISKKYGFEFDIKYAYQNYVGAVDAIKKVVTIDELSTFIDDCAFQSWKDQLVWFKNIWENPEQFNEET